MCGRARSKKWAAGEMKVSYQVGSVVVEQPIAVRECGELMHTAETERESVAAGLVTVTICLDAYLSRGPGTCSYDTRDSIKLGGG